MIKIDKIDDALFQDSKVEFILTKAAWVHEETYTPLNNNSNLKMTHNYRRYCKYFSWIKSWNKEF